MQIAWCWRETGVSRPMTAIAIVAALLVTSLGAINIAWGASHLMDDSKPLRLTQPSAIHRLSVTKGR